MQHRLSLHVKQIIISILFGLVPFGIISIVAYFYVFRMLENEQNVSSYYNTQNIANTLDHYIHNFKEISLFLIGNEYIRAFLSYNIIDKISSADYNTIYDNAYNMILLLPFGSKASNTIGVFSLDGRNIISGTNRNMVISKAESNKSHELKGAWFWSISDNKLSICRLFRDKNCISTNLGYIKISTDREALDKLFVSNKDWSNSKFILYDIENQNILSKNIERKTTEILENSKMSIANLIKNDKKSFEIIHKGNKYLVTPWKLTGRKTILASLTKDLSSRYNQVLLDVILLAIILTIVMCIAQIWLFELWMIRPLKNLGLLMQSIEYEDFSVRSDFKGKDEIALLAKQFNLMSEKLQFLHKEVYISNLKMKDAEIQALQSEINPHFLFNTLNIIYWMVRIGDTENVSKTVKSLSDLFRISIYKTADGLIPLPIEIEHIRNYLIIQQMRLKDNLIYSIDVEEGLEDLRVVKLVLQPLVENAILHGIEPMQGGEIIVSVYTANNILYYCVYDNGVGVNPEEIARYIRSENKGLAYGLALRNVSERLKLKFGENFGLHCEQPADGGTVFIVKQPIVHEKKDIAE